jgi:hypothetical protein
MNYYEVMLSKQRNRLSAEVVKEKRRDAIQMVVIACLCVTLLVVAL